MKVRLSSLILTFLLFFCLVALSQPLEGASGPRLSTSSVLGFGAVALGSSSSNAITIKNKGTADLIVDAPVSSDPEFTVDSTTCSTVAAGGSCSVAITFTPTAYTAKAKTATLTITSNDSRSPAIVKLKGSCPPPRMYGVPKAVKFGLKKAGFTYAKSFTIKNKGTSPLSMSSFVAANDDADNQDFSLSDDTTCVDASLMKGETCVVWIYFKPSNAGTRSGSLTFTYNDSASISETATVNLRGKVKGASSTSPPVIYSFSALPIAVELGNSSTLSWNVSNAKSLSINQGVGAVSGTSVAVTPSTTGRITYTLTASNSYGSTTAKTTVTVSSSGTPEVDSSPFAVSVAESASTYDAADVVTNTTFAYTALIDFTNNTARLSTGTAQEITTAGVTLVTEDSTSLVVAKTTYGITITSTLGSPVNYKLSGDLAGTLTVVSSSLYELYLDEVSLTGSSGPALFLNSTQKAFIVTASGKVNTLSDQSTRSGMTQKAAVFSKGPMIFSGSGTLSVTGNYKHGIFSNDYVRVRGGTLQVSVTARDAIRTVNGFIFDNGALTISGTGTELDNESKGVKVEGSDESTYNGAGKGYIVVNGGHITINTVGKAMTASWDIDEDATTQTTADDPSPYVAINSGIIVINTTGTPYEYYEGTTKISLSPEGIEGKSYVTVNSGHLTIVTTDDAINAGKSITINGGYIYAASSTNDAIDSNGTMTIAGGVIVAIGSAIPEAAFDCDQNTFTITGGTFVGVAGSTSTPTASTCTQNTIILGSKQAGTTMALKGQDGTIPFAFTIPQSYTTMLLSSPDIAKGTKYTIYTGGSAKADAAFNGLYLDNISYTGGTGASSFTVSSCVTDASR